MFLNVERQNLSMSDYQSLNALSRSGVCDLLKSFNTYTFNKLNPKERTSAMKLGSAIHDYVLENKTFGQRYMVAPKCDRRTKEGKALWAEFEVKAEGLELLTEDDFNTCAEIGNACNNHPVASKLLKSEDREISLVGQYLINGETIAVKCRFDLLLSVDGLVYACDLKSCQSAISDDFSRDISTMNYHIQAAFYLDMLNAYLVANKRNPAQSFMFIAAEKSGPFEIAVYELDNTSLELGREMYIKGIKKLYDAIVNKSYTGVSNEIKSISVKPWSFYKNEELT
jgi:hypothetical protein